MNFSELNILSIQKPYDRTHFIVSPLKNYCKLFKQSLTRVNTSQTGCKWKDSEPKKQISISGSVTLALRWHISDSFLKIKSLHVTQ